MELPKPILVVLTPVFNEAWILPAFLKATSLWADYIIIADQMSTDGSRDLYKQFAHENHTNLHGRKCELIVVDNPRKEMHQAATRRLLFDAAKKIEGDKILFALDADEFLSGNFPATKGWQTIINSEPGDIFKFRWMNLNEIGREYYLTQVPYYWAAHVNDDLLNGEFPDNFIHEWRLPWPPLVHEEYIIDDICFIHFRRVNEIRQRNKARNYQVLQFSSPQYKHSGISIFRQYNYEAEKRMSAVPPNAYAFYESNGVDIWKELSVKDEGSHYTEAVLRKIREHGASYFRKLDIWDKDFLSKYNLQDPRRPIDKLIHWYLRTTEKISKNLIIRCVDKVLKQVY